MNLSSLVGTRLKEIREEAQLSQAEMGVKVGVSREMWGRYERGALPGGDVFLALGQADFDVTYILTGKRVSGWEREVLAQTAKTIAEIESDPNGPLHQSYKLAVNATGKRQEDLRPEFTRLEQALVGCNVEDSALVIDMALMLANRLARGTSVKPVGAVKKAAKKAA